MISISCVFVMRCCCCCVFCLWKIFVSVRVFVCLQLDFHFLVLLYSWRYITYMNMNQSCKFKTFGFGKFHSHPSISVSYLKRKILLLPQKSFVEFRKKFYIFRRKTLYSSAPNMCNPKRIDNIEHLIILQKKNIIFIDQQHFPS